jgi:hypothetical protein
MNTVMGSQVDSVHRETSRVYRSSFDPLRVSDVGDDGPVMVAIRRPVEHLHVIRRDDLDQLPNPPEISPFTEIGYCFENGHHTYMIERCTT